MRCGSAVRPLWRKTVCPGAVWRWQRRMQPRRTAQRQAPRRAAHPVPQTSRRRAVSGSQPAARHLTKALLPRCQPWPLWSPPIVARQRRPGPSNYGISLGRSKCEKFARSGPLPPRGRREHRWHGQTRPKSEPLWASYIAQEERGADCAPRSRFRWSGSLRQTVLGETTWHG